MEDRIRKLSLLPLRAVRVGTRPILLLAAHLLEEARDQIDRRITHNLDEIRANHRGDLENLELYAKLRGILSA